MYVGKNLVWSHQCHPRPIMWVNLKQSECSFLSGNRWKLNRNAGSNIKQSCLKTFFQKIFGDCRFNPVHFDNCVCYWPGIQYTFIDPLNWRLCCVYVLLPAAVWFIKQQIVIFESVLILLLHDGRIWNHAMGSGRVKPHQLWPVNWQIHYGRFYFKLKILLPSLNIGEGEIKLRKYDLKRIEDKVLLHFLPTYMTHIQCTCNMLYTCGTSHRLQNIYGE